MDTDCFSLSGSITDPSGLLPLPVNDIIVHTFTCFHPEGVGLPADGGLTAEAGMGEAAGEAAAEVFCFCCSMSSNSRPLAAALCLFSSRRRCSTVFTEQSGEVSCTRTREGGIIDPEMRV